VEHFVELENLWNFIQCPLAEVLELVLRPDRILEALQLLSVVDQTQQTLVLGLLHQLLDQHSKLCLQTPLKHLNQKRKPIGIPQQKF
jgi:hypothetical protein